MKAFHQERVNRKSGIEMAKAMLRDEYYAACRIPTNEEVPLMVLGRKLALEEMFKRLTDELRLIKESEDWLTSNPG